MKEKNNKNNSNCSENNDVSRMICESTVNTADGAEVIKLTDQQVKHITSPTE